MASFEDTVLALLAELKLGQGKIMAKLDEFEVDKTPESPLAAAASTGPIEGSAGRSAGGTAHVQTRSPSKPSAAAATSKKGEASAKAAKVAKATKPVTPDTASIGSAGSHKKPEDIIRGSVRMMGRFKKTIEEVLNDVSFDKDRRNAAITAVLDWVISKLPEGIPSADTDDAKKERKEAVELVLNDPDLDMEQLKAAAMTAAEAFTPPEPKTKGKGKAPAKTTKVAPGADASPEPTHDAPHGGAGGGDGGGSAAAEADHEDW